MKKRKPVWDKIRNTLEYGNTYGEYSFNNQPIESGTMEEYFRLLATTPPPPHPNPEIHPRKILCELFPFAKRTNHDPTVDQTLDLRQMARSFRLP